MPSIVDSPAPTSAPATRAESMVARDMPSAPIRCVGRDRLADERVAHHEIVGAHDAGQRGEREDPGGRQPRRSRPGAVTALARRRRSRASRRAWARPPSRSPSTPNMGAARVPRNCSEPKSGEQQHRAGLHHDVPAQDDRLHLERPGGEEIGGPLEAEAADAEGGEDQRAPATSSIQRRMNARGSGTKPVITNWRAPAAIARRICATQSAGVPAIAKRSTRNSVRPEAIRQAGVAGPGDLVMMRVVLALQGPDGLVQVGRHALALEREAEGVVGAGGQRHLDVLDRGGPRVGQVGLGEPPHVDVSERAPGRARAALDRGERERDHLRRQAEAARSRRRQRGRPARSVRGPSAAR